VEIKQQMHSDLVESLRSISRKIEDPLFSKDEKKESIENLQNFIAEQLLIKQAIEHSENLLRKKKLEQKKMEILLLQKYEELEKEMVEDPNCPENVHRCLNISNDLEIKLAEVSFFKWRRACMTDALRHFLKKDCDFNTFFFSGERSVKKFFSDHPNAQYLEKLKSEIIDINNFFESVARVKVFGEYILLWEMVPDVHRVCRFLVDMIFDTASLATLKIEKISYNNLPKNKKGKAVLSFSIGEKQIFFLGLRAISLNLAMKNPYEEVECEDSIKKEDYLADKKDYDKMYRMTDSINQRLFKEFKEYGLADFLIQNGYSFRVNPKFKNLIKPLASPSLTE